MQLHAYDLWASLVGPHGVPRLQGLSPADHPALSSYGVLLDFRRDATDPHILFLGDSLAEECGMAGQDIACVSDLPQGSLVARITEHYLRAVVAHEPIGFEAEFVNQREKTILYRGILLPFSSEGSVIDHVFAVINWKELAEESLVGELLLELDQALTGGRGESPVRDIATAHAFSALPPIGERELETIDAAGGEVTLVAVGRGDAGQPVVLGEVSKGSGLFARVAERLRG